MHLVAHNLVRYHQSGDAGRVALTFFFNLMELWGCTKDQQCTLLGAIGNTTYFKYKTAKRTLAPRHPGAHFFVLDGHPQGTAYPVQQQAWNGPMKVHKPNTAAPFIGQSALGYMLVGQVVDLADVRRYLDGVRG